MIELKRNNQEKIKFALVAKEITFLLEKHKKKTHTILIEIIFISLFFKQLNKLPTKFIK